MQLEVAAHAGFCMGVRRAVEAAWKVAESGKPACTLGELIHNPQVVRTLGEQGVPVVDDPDRADGRLVLIRSHGVSPDVLQQLRNAGSDILDLTCPFVDRLHRIVRSHSADGTPVILVGERDHPEVQGTAGWAQGPVYVVDTVSDAEQLPEMEQALACVQTTFPMDRWLAVLEVLRRKVQRLAEQCTICSATATRQQEAMELASRADAMVVIGGRKSANTHKLYEACAQRCPNTILVETAAEIPHDFIRSEFTTIGITAGASTPDDQLKEAVTIMTDIENKTQEVAAEAVEAAVEAAEEVQEVKEPLEDAKKDFMAAVDETLVRIRPGQTVTGTVVQITEDEVCVNIGFKSDGLIKKTDLAQEDVKLGDEIEVEVVKVNDGEGNVILSQRNIVNRKAWEALMAKNDAGEYVDGVGKEAVKGGLLADVGGVRAFVPASQIAPRYVERIGDFVGKEMKLKIIEVDKQKKRIVCSRKAVIIEEAAARKKEAWDRLEEGYIIHGIVRRLTDFGAFVDVGGVDGLVHITDLSWGRIKHPSEVVKPGQEVDVQILSLDRERERIQLGLKQLTPKPWDNATEKYPVGAIVEGKVVRITTFGAFVELEPGLDGLVHISQCALTKIAKVEDAVQVGEIRRVKVLNVDTEAKRISLSIRQVLEEEAEEVSGEELEFDENQPVVSLDTDEPAAVVEEAAEAVEAVEEIAEAIEEAAPEA
ncbi:MAG: bifunctional 4-hydroxy-3-methylbut-2-enyl diphosphate reductase/30S ribosomal protein S1 [Clostridia bacterium]|nr:bifunctional 4-hydroxy-3-methylbut-2-enyl diphosphate reductase/30S ribosomal protein S1 [Clostridia bacterium]MBR2286918.1 bifunctional 4-hydroxy-3-methylbut-2-enyl diphosphate reductase/30S ribosomal protein S1 [Clostridia bacterium]